MTRARHATIVVERHLDAAPERVFSAWTVERGHWDVPKAGWVVAELESDLRVDGWHRTRFGPSEDPAFESRGRYLEVREDELLVMAGVLYERGAPTTATMTTIDITPDGDGTQLVVTDQSAYFGGETPDMREAGLSVLVDHLEEHLSTSPRTP